MKQEQIRRSSSSRKSKMMMKNPQEEHQQNQQNQQQQPPALFLCPISLEIMRDPVIVCTGQTYDRPSIEKWIRDGHRSCPITMLHLHDLTLIPNIIVRQLIEAWCSSEESASAMFASPFHHQNHHQHQQCQSQSELMILSEQHQQQQQQHQLFILSEIPGSRTAEDDEDEEEGEGGVNREQVLILLRRIAKGQEVKQSVGRLKAMAKDEIAGSSSVSEKKVCCCIMEAGGALLMASMLADELLQEGGGFLLHKEGEDNPCEEIMSLLAILCRSGSREVIGAVLSESGALECVIGHLGCEIGIACRMNAAMLLKRLLVTDEIRAAITRFSTEFFAGLLDLIDRSCCGGAGQQQHCSSRSRKSLVKLLHMACSHKPNRFKAVEQGAIEILTKLLASFSSSCSSSSASSSNNNNNNNNNANNSHDDRTASEDRDRTVEMGERALAALELLCTVEAGRSAVCRCTAAVHCTVRMLVGYSRQCTEHATGCLLLVCQSGPVEVLQIAMKAGARRQLLLLLQSDCTGRAKKKALELLKLFHAIFFVAGGEQHVSSDFKNVDLYSN